MKKNIQPILRRKPMSHAKKKKKETNLKGLKNEV